METALSIARMISGRVFERFDLAMCLAHGGGCLPWLRGRLDLGWERKEVAHTTEIPPSEFCKRLYYDTAVFDTTLLSHLVSDMGADRVLLGTDHPFELGDTDPLATVRALDLGVDDTEAILWRTADSLLGLPSSAQAAARSAKHGR
jgi:aminocarboxymuconate-semialdehyde decarboxylase